MPVDWSKYPSDWKQIARDVKEKAGWKCQQCDRPCRESGESWDDFCLDLLETKWYEQTFDVTPAGKLIERPQRFTLTVAHLDHDTTNNAPENLKALCSGCHLRYDAKLHAKNASATRRERSGQLTLTEVVLCVLTS